MCDSLKELLDKEGIVEVSEDLRGLTPQRMRKYFGSGLSNRIVLSRLIKSVIWQAYRRIQTRDEAYIFTNIRSFWYRWVKPAVAKVPQRDRLKTDAYNLMIRLFTEMVLDLKLFTYADFEFTDENYDNRKVGSEKAAVLIFAEKRGWMRFLRVLNKEYGVSILSTGGFPSALTSEYAVRALKTVVGEEPIKLIGIVDFDPSGDLIANSFVEQLEKLGQKISGMETVIHPRHYTEEELELFRFELPRRRDTKAVRWLEKTGGINGESYGLESESMPLERLIELMRNLIVG